MTQAEIHLHHKEHTSTFTKLSDTEKLAWLRLIRSENVGPITFFELLKHYGNASAALEALPQLAKQGGKKALKIRTPKQAELELEAHQRHGAHLIGKWEPEYPSCLRVLGDSPPLLSLHGDLSLTKQPMIAIVGARNASLNGCRFAERLAKELGEAGLVVISGLARGIDAAAHKGSLQTGTVGAIAGGIDAIYPPENTSLYQQLRQQGLIVAEAPFGTAPQANHFPRRNRIISGMAYGVVVIEAAFKSGSLITARNALDQGREVFAVPGFPLDPRSQGSNHLLKQGAYLVQSSRDILEALPPFELPDEEVKSSLKTDTELSKNSLPSFGLNDTTRPLLQKKIMENLSSTPVTIDELVRACHNSPQGIWQMLLEMELTGQIQRHSGNQVSKVLG